MTELTEVQRGLYAALALIRDFRECAPMADLREHGYEYSSPEDFVLRHGEWFEPIPLPGEYEFGPLKACYLNSARLARQFENLTYVEGYGYWSGAGFAVSHAWCVDTEGRLIDTTWRREGDEDYAYLGVRFSLERVEDGGSVLDDWQQKWPILREAWKGDFDLVGS